MKITIESTTKLVFLDGVQCRIWEGTTERGVPIHCFIPLIQVAANLDNSELEEELRERREPSPEVKAIPMRLIL